MQKSAYHLHWGYKEGDKEMVALKDEQRKVQGSRAKGNRKSSNCPVWKKKRQKQDKQHAQNGKIKFSVKADVTFLPLF